MSDTVGGVLATLQEMGFSEARSQKALAKTGWKGVEAAMEWLLAHPEGQDDDDEEEDQNEAAAVMSDEPKKELTAEEKAEQLKRLEVLRVQKRTEREEREKQEKIERDKKMRAEAKAMSGIKRDLEDQEIRRMAEQRRREKEETRLAKEKVKAQIEADRRARKEREAAERGEIVAKQTENKPPETPTQAEAPKEYAEARLQIRLPSGSPLVHVFRAKETLSAVRLFVQLNRKDGVGSESPVRLSTSFPRRVFEEEDYEKPLDSLGLTPSAVLMVAK